MREITIISGKGGTGKTSLTAAFASLANNHIVCDLDVDAADLHILLTPKVEVSDKFISGKVAIIDEKKCIHCGYCQTLCNFAAIKEAKGVFKIDPIKCEGCGFCVKYCPEQTIGFPNKTCGHWYQSKTRIAPFIHAKLLPGEENSGLLVSLLRKKAKVLAENLGADLILCDGSPGIGCPVIASLTGTDLAVIITEPTPSGLHDMNRVLELCKHFRVAAKVIINKYDLSPDYSSIIEKELKKNGIPLIGKIPFDDVFIKAMIAGKTVIEYDDKSNLSKNIKQIWQNIVGESKNE
jgi:MinD superfamily P-loop ATPase